MIIGIDAACLGINDDRLKVGVYRYAISLLSHLCKLSKNYEYRLYSFVPIEKEILSLFGSNVKNIVLKPALFWFTIRLPLELFRHPVRVFIGLSQSLPLLPPQTKGVTIFHDLTFEKYPQWFDKTYAKMSVNSKKAASKADTIITVSQNTKDDLVKIYRTNPKKIKVIYSGINDLKTGKPPKNKNRVKILRFYGLFVGTYKPNKNIPNIIKGFIDYISKHKNNLALVLVGSNFWIDQLTKETLKLNKKNKQLINLGFVPDHRLINLYKHASFFISPSFYEGFGFTHLEAIKYKLPVIAAKSGSLPEVLGRGAHYVDPNSPQDIARGISKVLNNKKYTNKLINQSQKNIEKFSWDKTGEEVFKLLNKYL